MFGLLGTLIKTATFIGTGVTVGVGGFLFLTKPSETSLDKYLDRHLKSISYSTGINMLDNLALKTLVDKEFDDYVFAKVCTVTFKKQIPKLGGANMKFYGAMNTWVHEDDMNKKYFEKNNYFKTSLQDRTKE